MTNAIAAYRAGNAPHILQVFEVGTATMMAGKGAVVPVYKLMKDADEPFDPKVYIGPVSGYYSDSKGNMLSFPFNSSTVVFYINKDAYKKAGLDPEQGAEDVEGIHRRRPRSSRPPGSSASTRPAGRPGCTSRTSPPGTTCPSARRKTAWAGWTPSSR